MGSYKGWVAAVLTVLASLFTVGSAYYLIWGHRSEYVAKIREIEGELKAR